jgi:phosphotransferase family enzyme
VTTARSGSPTRHPAHFERTASGMEFVKVARSADDRAELEREAGVYDLLRARCPAMARCVPRTSHWDCRTGTLALEAIAGRDLRRVILDDGILAEQNAVAVGNLLGVLHAEGARLAHDPPERATASGAIDWHRPGPARLRLLSGGGIDLLEMLQRGERLCRHLRRVAVCGPASTLTHGDLRWENVIVEREDARGCQVRLVDWEFAGWGEPEWDAACFISACLGAWLSTTPHVPSVRPDRLLDLAAIPLQSVRPGIRAFWSAYAHGGALARSQPRPDLLRCAELVAVRLVHLAFEATAGHEYIRAAEVAHLQVALNMLDDPLTSAFELLGIAA